MIAIDLVAVDDPGIRREMRDDLVSVKVEIDPFRRTSAFLAVQDAAVELARFLKIAHRKCKMEKIHTFFRI